MHTVGLEVAKKLKEAGFEMDAKFFWCLSKIDPDVCTLKHWSEIDFREAPVPAYTLGELIRGLPRGYTFLLESTPREELEAWFFNFEVENSVIFPQMYVRVASETPENAVALALIKYKEQEVKK
jgi:hypothetical protein